MKNSRRGRPQERVIHPLLARNKGLRLRKNGASDPDDSRKSLIEKIRSEKGRREKRGGDRSPLHSGEKERDQLS